MTTNGNTSGTICAHLRACEEALLDPAVRRDTGQVAALLAEDFEEFGSSGRVWSREQTLELLATEDYRPLTMEDFKCDCLGPDVALLTYRSVRTDADSGQRSLALRSSLWTRELGVWRLRFHQGTKAQGTKAQ